MARELRRRRVGVAVFMLTAKSARRTGFADWSSAPTTT